VALGGGLLGLGGSRSALGFASAGALVVRGVCRVLFGVAFVGGLAGCGFAVVGGLVAAGGGVGSFRWRSALAGAWVFAVLFGVRGGGWVCVPGPRAGLRGGLVGLGGGRLCGAAAALPPLGAGVGGLRAGAVGGALVAAVVLPVALAGAAC
jgi:hypothetical protein